MELQIPLPVLVVGFAISAVASILICVRIAHSADPLFMKVMLLAIVAIPFFGPVLWLFLDMPSRRPGVPSPFRGPIAPLPTKPKWLAISTRVLILLSGGIVVGLLIYVLLSTIKTIR